jgi:Sec-independent protein translocase protein TatA
MVEEGGGRSGQARDLRGRREIRHGLAYLALHAVPVLVEGPPVLAHLPGQLGEAVRAEEDDGDDRDDEELGGVEVEHALLIRCPGGFGWPLASGSGGGSEYFVDHHLVDRAKESHMLAEVFGVDGIIVLIVVVVLLFGGAAIPKLARNLGSAKNEFEKGLDEGKKASAASPVAITTSDTAPPTVAPTHVSVPDHSNPGS